MRKILIAAAILSAGLAQAAETFCPEDKQEVWVSWHHGTLVFPEDVLQAMIWEHPIEGPERWETFISQFPHIFSAASIDYPDEPGVWYRFEMNGYAIRWDDELFTQACRDPR